MDGTGNSGTNGQVLFSTGNQTQWNDITTLATAPTLTGVGQLTDGGSLELAGASSVFIQGDYAYVAARNDNGLQVIDISDPSSPTGVGQLTNGGSLELNNPRSVFVQGNYAYVAANGDDGLQVIDISNPSSPTGVGQLTGTLSTNSLALDGAHSVYVQGNYAYVASFNDDGLQVIDISDPTNPVGVGQLTEADNSSLALATPISVFVQGNYAYVVSTGDNGLQVIDISDPTNPTGVGQLTGTLATNSLALANPQSVFVQGNYAYVASFGNDGLQVIDISDPTNPVGVGQLVDDGVLALDGATSVFVQGNYAYVTSLSNNGLQVIDISDPTNPTGVGQLTEADDASLALFRALSVFVQGNYAYVASLSDNGLQAIELGQNSLSNLEVGALEASGLQVDNHAQFNNYVDVKGGLSVGSSLKVDGDAGFNGVLTANSTTTLNAALVDGYGISGTNGQLLSSTGTRTQWITTGILPATAGQNTNTTTYWNGSAWVNNQNLLTDGTTTTTITTDLSVTATDTILNSNLTVSGNTTLTGDLIVEANTTAGGTLTANSTTTLNAALVDGYGISGTNGQLLSSTGTRTQWITTGILPATAGQNTNTTAYWNGTAWVNNQNLLTDGTTTTTITTDLSVTATDTLLNSDLAVSGNTTMTGDLVVAANTTASGTLTANSTMTLNAALVDSLGSAGTADQILTTTGTSTVWRDNNAPNTGTTTNTTLRWNGSEWVENERLLAGTNVTSITTDLSVPPPTPY